MNKEQEIKEIINTMFKWAQKNKMCWNDKHAESLAKAVYNEGYRKITFNERFSREYIRETLKEELCQEVRKETAKEIFNKIKNSYRETGVGILHSTKVYLDTLAKEYDADIDK